MPEVRKQSFYIYEICDVANSDKTITKIKAKYADADRSTEYFV